jgi:hypothetical protein
MSNFLTPVKNTNVTYDKFIFSLFIKVDNSPEAKPGTIKYKCHHCSRPVKCCGSTNSNLYKHLLRDDHRELREKADANKLTEQNNKLYKYAVRRMSFFF